jgi:hypothetical protein
MNYIQPAMVKAVQEMVGAEPVLTELEMVETDG